MHDIIAFFQIGEINVQRGARGQRVRRFLAARSLDFVTAKNFRIGDDDKFCFVANESASERADLDGRDIALRCPVGVVRRPYLIKTMFLPDFPETLAFAVVVAENVDGIILPQPAMKLLEKFAPLRLGNLRFRRAFGQRTKGVKAFKLQICFAGFGSIFAQFNRGETAPVQFDQKIRP